MLHQMVRSAVHVILPNGPKERTIFRGLAKGIPANIDFKWDTAFYFGLHEPVLHQHYRRLLKPGMRSFDIGAYRGWDALSIARLTGSQVVTFDLAPRSIEIVKSFVSASRLPIIAKQAMFGNGGATIDEMSKEFFYPDFIKMDIEGGEAAVLRDAPETLKRGPALIIEVHSEDLERDCLDTLHHKGYRAVIVNPERHLFSERRGYFHNRWLVCERIKQLL